MVRVDEYARIRRAHAVEKLSVRQLARRFHHSRRKIREILGQPEPKPYARRPTPPSLLDPFKSVIDDMLRADEQAPRKQRHSAAKVFRRLRDEHGYTGGAERVRLYVRGQKPGPAETFIPLDHDPGQRLEADFGHIYVDFPQGRQLVPVLVVTWAYSNCPFALALPSERTEAILHGLVEAFAFFGCVPHELWWDNPKTVAPQLLTGRERKLNDRYQALASHYLFEPRFCLVRRPQEKPRVEGRVRFLQRDWATPVPAVHDLAELNAHLRACALRDRDRTQAGQTETIGHRFARECAKALSLPAFPFDPCIFQPAKVDKYQTVRFDHNRYSAPRLDKTDVLICDELGYLSFSRGGAELLFQVFAERYERKSLLLTSNLPFGEWGQIFQGERMTAALLDRLTHRCHILEMNGESFRFRESMKAKKGSKVSK